MQRNADGQFPKKLDRTKDELYEAMGYTEKEAKDLIARWNDIIRKHKYSINGNVLSFLEEVDMTFTKRDVLFLTTIEMAQP